MKRHPAFEARYRECAHRLAELRAGRPAKGLDCNDLAVLGLLPADPSIGTEPVHYDAATDSLQPGHGNLIPGESPDGRAT